MKSRYTDSQAIIQVMAGVAKDPSLLDDERYHFSIEDFTEEMHRIIFGSMYNLYQTGVKEFNSILIEDYLAEKPEKLAIFKTHHGDEYIEQLQAIANLSTFGYYYSRMKKMTLLRMYNELCGMDLNWLYDKDNILDVKKKQAQDEYLDNASLEQIADKINNKIEDVRLKYADGACDEESVAAGEDCLNILNKYKETPDVGIPMFGNLVNTVTRGARLGKIYLRSAPTGVGKALPNSTIIPTLNGFKTVGEIREGDLLFDAFGKPTKVLKVYPQGLKDVYEVKFKDGRVAKCCNEHLWSYCTAGQGKKAKQNRQFYTNTLEEINKKSLYQQGEGYKILVPMNYAVEYPTKKYSIDPYVFGLLLGDGSFRYTNEQKALFFSSENEELPNEIARIMNWDVVKNSGLNYNWTFKWKENSSHTNVWVEEVLRDYPQLWNIKSENKFIPKEFLQGDINQRFELLNGLLDSDGSIDKEKGRITYFTISKDLRDNVIELARSLGFKTSILEDDHKDTNICYRIEISGRPEDKVKLFKLNRKKELVEKWYNNGKRKESNEFNPIVEISKLDYKEEMTCFYVDNNEHLFLMNDFIVTHNTRTMIADACMFSCGTYYDVEKNQWIDIGSKAPTLYIGTEQELDELRTMIIAFISGVNEEKILYGNYETDEWERCTKAIEILNNSPLYLKVIPDFCLKDIENTIKREIRERKISYFCFDYIHSTLKILGEITSATGVKGLREDNILFMLSAKLKELCVKYNVFIITATQLNGSYTDAEVLDQNSLRGAKAIADKVDLGAIMVETNEKDIASLQNILEETGFEAPKIKISVYKNRGGKYKGIYLWCKENRGICRVEPLFATTYNYQLIDIDNVLIKVKRPSAF